MFQLPIVIVHCWLPFSGNTGCYWLPFSGILVVIGSQINFFFVVAHSVPFARCLLCYYYPLAVITVIGQLVLVMCVRKSYHIFHLLYAAQFQVQYIIYHLHKTILMAYIFGCYTISNTYVYVFL